MKKTFLFLKKEILEMLPPTIFFFLVFQILHLVEGLLAKEFGISLASTTSAFISALIVGKSILLVDALPMLKWFREKRLIYTVLWRIFFYVVIVVFIQFIEEMIPLISKYGSLSSGVEHLFKEIKWDHFWSIHIILMLLVIFYTFTTAVIEVIGRKEYLGIFFNPKNKIKQQH